MRFQSTKRIRLNRMHTPPQARDDTSNFKFSGVPPAPSTLYHVDRMKLQFLFRLDRPFFLAGGWADTRHLKPI
jgi:P pilus assembly chaperone PapD